MVVVQRATRRPVEWRFNLIEMRWLGDTEHNSLDLHINLPDASYPRVRAGIGREPRAPPS